MPQDCKIEYLGGNISVFCSKEHRFGTDAVLLENFALGCSAKAHNILDLGCGCGIIAMLFARDTDAFITALDIQPQAAELVKAAADYNNLGGRMSAVCLDLKELKNKSEYKNKYDLVTMNPPYKRIGSGIMSASDALNTARFELKCNFDDICQAAESALKFGGKFCVCNRPNRLCDMITAMKKCNIEPKRMQTVSQRSGDKPMLILLEGVLGGNADMDIMPPLFLEDGSGKMTNDASKIYEKWEYERKNAPLDCGKG